MLAEKLKSFERCIYFIFWSWFRCSPACAPCPKRHGWGNGASKMSPGLTYLLGQCPSAGLHQKATELNSSVMPCRPEIEILCVGGETHYASPRWCRPTTTNCFVLVPRTYHPCCNGFENQVENSSRTFGCYLSWGGASKNCWKEVTEDIASFLENVIDLEWIKVPVTWNMTSKMNLANWILLLRLDPSKRPGPNHRGVLFSVSLWSRCVTGCHWWTDSEFGALVPGWMWNVGTLKRCLSGRPYRLTRKYIWRPLHALYNIHLRHLRWNFYQFQLLG